MNKYFISFVIEMETGSVFGNSIVPTTEKIDSLKNLNALQDDLKPIIEKEHQIKIKSIVILNFQEL